MVTAAYDVIERLSDFLIEPQESLEVEIKRWLNLSDSEHKANLAKAILAIANHGGGIIIIGFEEKLVYQNKKLHLPGMQLHKLKLEQKVV